MLKFLQVNLKHSKNASDNLKIFVADENIDVILIQEPWIKDSTVKGLKLKNYNLFYKKEDVARGNPRACFLAKKHVNTLFCSNFSSKDLTVVKLEQNGGSGMYIPSVYMAHDKDAPPTEFKNIINSIRPCSLVGGCARHSIWGSSEINERGELLFDFICSFNLELCNRGSTPTFIFPSSDRREGWEEVLDITMVNCNDLMKVCNWRVSVTDSWNVLLT